MHMAYFIRPQAGGYDTFETLDFGEGIDKKRVKISGLKPSLDKDRTVIEQTDIGWALWLVARQISKYDQLKLNYLTAQEISEGDRATNPGELLHDT